MTHLQVSDDRRVVVDGLAVDGLPHALPVEGELLHRLLLGEVRPLVEDLPRRLVLEARHVEEPLRRADVRRHGDPLYLRGGGGHQVVSFTRRGSNSFNTNTEKLHVQNKNQDLKQERRKTRRTGPPRTGETGETGRGGHSNVNRGALPLRSSTPGACREVHRANHISPSNLPQ